MKTKQTIAIIGATGNMGSAISRNLSKGNYRLLLFSKRFEEAQRLVNDIKSGHSAADVEATECSREASWEADIIILAVPYTAEAELAEKIKEFANQKVVISISNPLNETYSALVTAPDSSAAEELQKLLPNARVVKAFNSTFAGDFSQTLIDGKQVDAFVAGNDQEALEAVSKLVSAAGFNPIVAGDLSVSRTLENMQLLLIQLNLKYDYNWVAGWKILHN